MVLKTHIAGGILAAEIVEIFTSNITGSPAGQFLTVAGAAVLGSMIPDIDHPNSKIAKSNPITRFISKIFKHRGVLHAPVFWCAIVLILYWVGLTHIWNGYGMCILIGLICGIASHLLLDSLNPTGIMWLWPIGRRKFHVATIKTGSATDVTLSYALFVSDVILFVYLFLVKFLFATGG